MTKKTSVGTFRSSADPQKKAEEYIDILLYIGIGTTMIFFLIQNWLPQCLQIYAITLTILLPTINYIKQHKKTINNLKLKFTREKCEQTRPKNNRH